MKIAFLVTRLDKPSARYRALQYLPYLREKGHIPDSILIAKKYWERLAIFGKMKNYDVVFLQKKPLGAIECNVLRRHAKTLVYDFDDAVMFRDSQRGEHLSGRRRRNFVRTVKSADVVIAGNEYLRSFALKENPNTSLIPTSVDMERYTERPTASESKSLLLGWIGSSKTLMYLENMKSIWDTIYDRFPHVKLKIVGDRFFHCERMPVIKKPWKYEEEIDDLHSFDIGLMPLTDDPWSRGKCGFKLLQYMAVGVPAVCSPVGVNREIVSDGLNGFWARNEQEWIDKLSTLIRDRQLRLHMGKKTRETVIKNYSTEINKHKLLEVLHFHHHGAVNH
jgi:glycosyltransferase involved in cell wall biosynthesis